MLCSTKKKHSLIVQFSFRERSPFDALLFRAPLFLQSFFFFLNLLSQWQEVVVFKMENLRGVQKFSFIYCIPQSVLKFSQGPSCPIEGWSFRIQSALLFKAKVLIFNSYHRRGGKKRCVLWPRTWSILNVACELEKKCISCCCQVKQSKGINYSQLIDDVIEFNQVLKDFLPAGSVHF